MVVLSTTTPARQETAVVAAAVESHGAVGGGVLLGGILTVDMSAPRGGRAALSRQVARACGEHGFFRAVGHGVLPGPAARLDSATAAFFALAPGEKQRAGPPSPLGYGCRSIGFNGDVGELEYLLLHANPAAVAHRARTIDATDPSRFRSRALSAPRLAMGRNLSTAGGRVGFGEHSDPQILSLLRANDVDGLQVLLPDREGKEGVGFRCQQTHQLSSSMLVISSRYLIVHHVKNYCPFCQKMCSTGSDKWEADKCPAQGNCNRLQAKVIHNILCSTTPAGTNLAISRGQSQPTPLAGTGRSPGLSTRRQCTHSA
ncbi:hypothetical protein ABZP36_013847 [Zizania latifolia]